MEYRRSLFLPRPSRVCSAAVGWNALVSDVLVVCRPHIDVSDTGEIVRVIWSPPFMGPLRVKPEASLPPPASHRFLPPLMANWTILTGGVPREDVPRYYEAVREMEALVARGEDMIRFRLEPGTAVTFNQRRMLHGREEFGGGMRHLEGTYVNIDDFLSQLQILAGKRGIKRAAARTGNGAW
jgi:hypothetical protein